VSHLRLQLWLQVLDPPGPCPVQVGLGLAVLRREKGTGGLRGAEQEDAQWDW
jgi:hypothetical protein